MSFWNLHQRTLLQYWEKNRRHIEREVAERRRDLVRRNMRQSSEWNSYEPYTDWYLEREVEAFVAAVEEIAGSAQQDIDDESVDQMEQMLVEMIDRRRQLAPPEALRAFAPQEARIKGAVRMGLLRVQSQRRAERERGINAPARAPVRRKVVEDASPSPPSQTMETAGVKQGSVQAPPRPAPAPSSPAGAAEKPRVDAHRLADSLRRLAQLLQRLPDPEDQAESLEELQFIAEEITAEPETRKLRMVSSALERITARLACADAELASPAASLAEPIRRWFDVS